MLTALPQRALSRNDSRRCLIVGGTVVTGFGAIGSALGSDLSTTGAHGTTLLPARACS